MAAGGAAFGGDALVEDGSAIAVGMVEERAQPGNLFLGRVGTSGSLFLVSVNGDRLRTSAFSHSERYYLWMQRKSGSRISGGH
jgi:hypothetical protein